MPRKRPCATRGFPPVHDRPLTTSLVAAACSRELSALCVCPHHHGAQLSNPHRGRPACASPAGARIAGLVNDRLLAARLLAGFPLAGVVQVVFEGVAQREIASDRPRIPPSVRSPQTSITRRSSVFCSIVSLTGLEAPTAVKAPRIS